MIEAIMYFGLGFLVASLIALVILPLVHARSARLAARRLLAELPVSMAEIHADRDTLRAEFAMATRRLELRVEALQETLADQQIELARKSDEVNRLHLDLGEKSATVYALQMRNRALGDEAYMTHAAPAVEATAEDQWSQDRGQAEEAARDPGLDKPALAVSRWFSRLWRTRKDEAAQAQPAGG